MSWAGLDPAGSFWAVQAAAGPWARLVETWVRGQAGQPGRAPGRVRTSGSAVAPAPLVSWEYADLDDDRDQDAQPRSPPPATRYRRMVITDRSRNPKR